MKLTLKNTWSILKQGFAGFVELDIPKMSAALAYYTVFALAPMLIVIISIVQFFYGDEAIQGSFYPQIAALLGPEAGKQIQDMITNAAISGQGTVSTIISVVILLITATGVFAEIQDSINTLWHLKAKPTGGIIKILLTRLVSFSMVVSLGFIMLVSLVLNSVIESLMNRLERLFSDAMVYVAYSINLVVTLAITTLLFATIFKVLPDAIIRWKQVLPGAIATAILFMLGKFGITLYLTTSDIGSTYGAAGSIIIILLWVYYSAIILYFGALLTRIYLACGGHTIRPNRYAVFVRNLQVENKGTLGAQPESEQIRAGLTDEKPGKDKRIGF